MPILKLTQRKTIVAAALLGAIVPFLFLVQAFASSSTERDRASEEDSKEWLTVFNESFEFEPLISWQLAEISGQKYSWSTTQASASHGEKSLKAAGVDGNLPASLPGPEQNSESASVELESAPIPVNKYHKLRLVLDAKLETESDSLIIEFSNEGQHFIPVKTLSGGSGIWQKEIVNLDGRERTGEIWIKLTYINDSGLPGGGVYLDNLRIEATDEDNLPLLLPVIGSGTEPTPEPGPGWLTYLNQFRTSTGLGLLTEEEEWSDGAWLHSRYMVLNDYVGHYEEPGNQWYTEEGAVAAKKSNVFVTSWLDSPDEAAINFWMVAPFHAVSMLDPELRRTGFGSYRADHGSWKMGATLDVIRGREGVPSGTTFPILYPSPGTSARLTQYWGGEFPDPLSSCPNYQPPTGPPIIIQLGAGELTPVVLAHSFESNGQMLESCVYDESTYVNSDSGLQYSGRVILNNRDAVVIMPRHPLLPGKSYKVSLTTQDESVSWTFHTPDGPSVFSIFGDYEQIVK